MTESDWNLVLLTLRPVLFAQKPVSRLGGSVAAVAPAFQLVGLEGVEAGREEVPSLPPYFRGGKGGRGGSPVPGLGAETRTGTRCPGSCRLTGR